MFQLRYNYLCKVFSSYRKIHGKKSLGISLVIYLQTIVFTYSKDQWTTFGQLKIYNFDSLIVKLLLDLIILKAKHSQWSIHVKT